MRMLFTFVIFGLVARVFAFPDYTGKSGAPGRETCASSCHGGPVTNTVSVSGFPATYTPGTAYLLTIKKLSGGSIVNFNSSCRVGLSGTTNAGVISSGLNTATYNVSGETNGVHFATLNHDSGQFTWTAPALGTGTVRLYAGALQSNIDGNNNTIVLTSSEALPLPGVAVNPSPVNLATEVAVNTVLMWEAGSGATSHDVHFGDTDPPAYIGNQAVPSFDPPGELVRGVTYFWRIDERNVAGATTGTVWQFTTLTPASPPQHLTALAVTGGIRLNWERGLNVVSYNVYRDSLFDVPATPANLIGTTADSSYFDASIGLDRAFYIVTSQ